MDEKPTPQAKHRVLCLHGIGTNSDIFEAQIGTLIRLLGPSFDYEFVDGSFPWPADTSVREAFGESFIGLSYFDGTGKSVEEAVTELANFVTEHCPFDIILRRSMGASIAATMLMISKSLAAPFRCAVFLNGMPPLSWNDEAEDEFAFLGPGQSAAKVQIPTIHAYGTNDEEHPGGSATLATYCDAANRQVILHDKGHRVPSDLDKCEEIAQAIRRITMQKPQHQ